jgi:multidrug efflux pump subunit AcrA (membrane-fusion protein)
MQEDLILQAKVIADNVKNIVSNNAGIISYLNCENGKKVSKNTLIATITPDWSDANIKSLLSQKNSLQIQTDNIKNIIFSTKKSFNSQLNSLQIQKANLETQISILQQNLQELEEQKKY